MDYSILHLSDMSKVAATIQEEYRLVEAGLAIEVRENAAARPTLSGERDPTRVSDYKKGHP